MVFIKFGKVDKKIIPLLLGCIFCFFNRILNTYKETILFKHIVITNIFVAISKLFIIIPYIIYKIRSRNTRNNSEDIEKTNSLSVKLYHANIKSKIDKGKWLFIFLSALIFFFQFLIFIYTITMKTNYWVWDILFVLLLCYLIFKIQFYKHHYLSLIIIILTGLIIDLIFQNIQNDIKSNLVEVLLRFVREILLSLHEVVNKYIMERKYGSEYEICFFNGVINLILFMFFSLLNYYFFKLDDFAEYFNNFNTTELLVVLGVMVSQLGFYLFALITNKNFTPCHVFIIFVFGQLAFHLDFGSGAETIVIFASFIFILFMSLIFNEIIELNFCGLSENIKRNIIFRAESEDFNIESKILVDTIDDNYEIYLKESEDRESKEGGAIN